jgi:archaellum biogenesis protein FlaJ (TadC family)
MLIDDTGYVLLADFKHAYEIKQRSSEYYMPTHSVDMEENPKFVGEFVAQITADHNKKMWFDCVRSTKKLKELEEIEKVKKLSSKEKKERDKATKMLCVNVKI